MQPCHDVVSVPLVTVRMTTRPCTWPSLSAALGSCAITRCPFLWGCWEYVYVMLTFVCSCLYLILRNTNAWFKIENNMKICCETSLAFLPLPQFPPLFQLTTRRVSYAYTFTPFLLFFTQKRTSSAPFTSPSALFLVDLSLSIHREFLWWVCVSYHLTDGNLKGGWCLEAISANQASLSYLDLQLCDHSTMCECGFLYPI